MTDQAEPMPDRRKGLRLPLLAGLILALVGAGIGFLEVREGTVSSLVFSTAEEHGEAIPPLGPISFLPLDPIVVNLPDSFEERHLSMKASLELAPGTESEVQQLLPRVSDILNTYLRALQPSDFDNPTMLDRLRSQMLHRIQLVTGEGRVRDLLIAEFVLN